MDRFETMRVFIRVVERRSFTAAAADLGLPRSTVTDAVKQIEARLGVRLLERTTRLVRPTLDGEAYHRRCLSLISDLEDAEAVAQKIEAAGGRALTAKADVSDPAAVRGMFDAAETAFGGLDVLLNNAGIMKRSKFADGDDASFNQQIAVNLKGTFNTMREAAKRLRDGGRVVNFSTGVVGTKL